VPTFAHSNHDFDIHGLSLARMRRATNDLLNNGIDALDGQKAPNSLKTYSMSA